VNNSFKRLVFGFLCVLVLTVTMHSRAQAQTPVPVYVNPQAYTYSDWQWNCSVYVDYVYIEPFPNTYRPYWYYGSDWYWGDTWNGYVPSGYWQPYFYNSCYWVLTAVYDMAMVQVANPDFWCTYTATITLSDNSTVIQEMYLNPDNGGAETWFTTTYKDQPSVVSATATKTCIAPPPPITVRLTFDDGPTSASPHNTRTVLAVLAANTTQANIPATFFVQTHVPNRGGAPGGIQTMEMELAAGHTLGIHTGSVTDHTLHTIRVAQPPYAGGANALESDLIVAKARIAGLAGGYVPTLVRAPTGATNAAVLQSYANQGLTHRGWDLDSTDSASGATMGSINVNVWQGMESRLAAGDNDIVVLFHDIKSLTADNLPTYIWNIRNTAKNANCSVLFAKM